MISSCGNRCLGIFFVQDSPTELPMVTIEMIIREDLLHEIRLVEDDLGAFKRSRDEIHRRIQDLEGTTHREKFISWAATQAIQSVLVMAIVRCEGLLEEYHKVLEQMDAPDNVVLLAKGDQDE